MLTVRLNTARMSRPVQLLFVARQNPRMIRRQLQVVCTIDTPCKHHVSATGGTRRHGDCIDAVASSIAPGGIEGSQPTRPSRYPYETGWDRSHRYKLNPFRAFMSVSTAGVGIDHSGVVCQRNVGANHP